MKVALFVLAIMTVTTVNAQAIRPCTNEVLTCRLDQELLSGGKIFLKETSAVFSGLNQDEPSIEPNECTLRLSLEHENTIFNVGLGDSDYMTNVYALARPNLGKILPGDASFPITLNKTFYFRYDRTILSCTLINR